MPLAGTPPPPASPLPYLYWDEEGGLWPEDGEEDLDVAWRPVSVRAVSVSVPLGSWLTSSTV